MKPTDPLFGPRPVPRAVPGDSESSARWHPSALEFARGVEVTEVVDTLPGELYELFAPSHAGDAG